MPIFTLTITGTVAEDLPTVLAAFTVAAQLSTINDKLDAIRAKQESVVTDIETLQQEVHGLTDATKSAELTMGRLYKLYSDALASNNIQAIRDITAELGRSRQSLAAAIVANTPAEPPTSTEGARAKA